MINDRNKKHGEGKDSRSPVQVVYGGAHLFMADTPQKLGAIALKSLETYAPNFVKLAVAMQLTGADSLSQDAASIAKLDKAITKSPEKIKRENFPAWLASQVYSRTVEKLKTEPVEDFRIDFEDGYGFRLDDEEDSHVISASSELAKAFLGGRITAFSGFRIKPFAPETRGRAIRTLNMFLENFLKKSGGKIPNNFVVTLPKVSDQKQVKELVRLLEKIERKFKLTVGSIGIEIMIETPEAVIDSIGRVALANLVKAAKGRCTSAHFGAYDYTASLGISAEYQNVNHDACNFARQLMLVTLAPLDIRLSDSVTTEMPVAIHKGEKLTAAQICENNRVIDSAWQTHFHNVTNSMKNGFYQSWDLHPNQLVARFAAVNAFYLEGLETQAARLRGFLDRAAQATLTGNIFDDAASARGLANFFVRGLNCGALSSNEVEKAIGSGLDTINKLFAASG